MKTPTNVYEAAAFYWASTLLIDDKREALFDALLARLPAAYEAQNEKGKQWPLKLNVDYDPDGVLLEATRAAGIECRGSMFSADGIYPSKTRTEIDEHGRFVVRDGYGAAPEVQWPPQPTEKTALDWPEGYPDPGPLPDSLYGYVEVELFGINPANVAATKATIEGLGTMAGPEPFKQVGDRFYIREGYARASAERQGYVRAVNVKPTRVAR